MRGRRAGVSPVGVPRVVGATGAVALLGEVRGHGGTAIGLGMGVGVRGLRRVSSRIAVLCLHVSRAA